MLEVGADLMRTFKEEGVDLVTNEVKAVLGATQKDGDTVIVIRLAAPQRASRKRTKG